MDTDNQLEQKRIKQPAAPNIPDPAQPLSNIQQEKFAIAAAAGRSPKQAAIDAGYATNSARQQGYDLITSPSIIARTSTLVRSALEAKGVSPDFLIQKTLDTLDLCLNRAFHDKEGNIRGDNVDSRGALDAIKILMQLRGMLTDNPDSEGEGNGILMSAAERRAKFRAILAQAGAKLEE